MQVELLIIMATVEVKQAERRPNLRLFWGSRARDIILVLFGAGLAVAPRGVADYTMGMPIAVLGIMGIIEGLRELKKPVLKKP